MLEYILLVQFYLFPVLTLEITYWHEQLYVLGMF
jgi:hypothetical protein